MKILCVIDHFGSGGAQRQMVALATGLKRRQCDVEFFVYHQGYDFFRREVSDAGIAVHEVAVREVGSIATIRSLRRVITGGRFDVVLAYMDTPGIYGEIACAGINRVALVVSERVDLDDSAGWRQNVRIGLHRLADRVVANSAYCAEQLRERFPWISPRLEVIRNGVDVDLYGSLACGQYPLSERSDDVKLVAVGTVTPRKNALAVVKALHILKSSGSAVPFVTWVGKVDNDPSSRSYRESVDREIVASGLGTHWTWAGEVADVALMLRGAHALLHPSHREGVSNAICEALAAGLPVLASDRGDNRWLVGCNERGMLFDPSEPHSIAQVISDFLRLDCSQRRNLGLQAGIFARQELALEQFVSNYERLFRTLVGS